MHAQHPAVTCDRNSAFCNTRDSTVHVILSMRGMLFSLQISCSHHAKTSGRKRAWYKDKYAQAPTNRRSRWGHTRRSNAASRRAWSAPTEVRLHCFCQGVHRWEDAVAFCDWVGGLLKQRSELGFCNLCVCRDCMELLANLQPATTSWL